MFEKQGTSSVSSEATKETCQHAKTKAAVPDARFKHPNRSAAVWLVPVYNPVGTKKPRLGFSILLHVAYRIYTKLSLSPVGPGRAVPKKMEIFPEFGVSAHQTVLFPSIPDWKREKGIMLIKSKIDDFLFASWLNLGRTVASKVTFWIWSFVGWQLCSSPHLISLRCQLLHPRTKG